MEQSNVDLPPRSSTFKPTTTTTDKLFGNSMEGSNENSGDNDQILNEVFPYTERFYIWFNFMVVFVIPVLVSLFIQKKINRSAKQSI